VEENINCEEIQSQEDYVEVSEKLDSNTEIFKNKKFQKKAILILAFIIAITVSSMATLWVYKYFSSPTSKKLDQINALVRKYYAGEIDDTVLDDALATAYMKALDDKYSFYKNAEDGDLVEQSLKGNAYGIGITVYNDNNSKALTVMRIDEDSPAHKAGLKIGDKIIAIDDKTIEETGYEEGIESIKRELGEKAKITVLRGEETLDFNVTYEDFVRQSVYYEIVDDYGYVTITAFNKSSVSQFKKAYKYLTEQKVKGLIFDVRENGGGTVDSVCEILDVLVGECDLITIVYADGSKNVAENAKSNPDKCSLPMVVLTNENTASAAELFAANLRDMAKAPLIGNNTYGKGVVQRTYFLEDGSCIRFTVGEFLPAGGKGFNKKGLAPDFEVNYTEFESANRYTLGKEEPYLKKAIEQLDILTSKEK
jgi:carboxyl-terminal processing protease